MKTFYVYFYQLKAGAIFTWAPPGKAPMLCKLKRVAGRSGAIRRPAHVVSEATVIEENPAPDDLVLVKTLSLRHLEENLKALKKPHRNHCYETGITLDPALSEDV